MSANKLAVMAFVGGLIFSGATVLAQQGPRGGGGGGGRGGRSGFDQGQFWQQMIDRLKQELSATEEQAKALQPKLEKLVQLRTNSYGSRGFRSDDPPSTNPVDIAARELSTLLKNKDAKPEEITAKLKALRDVRAKALEEQRQVQKEIKELLTPRQEAVMVMNGWLE